jgi:hypothetical protein
MQEIGEFDQLVPAQTLLGRQAVRVGDIRVDAVIQQEGGHLHRLLLVRGQDEERGATHPGMAGGRSPDPDRPRTARRAGP